MGQLSRLRIDRPKSSRQFTWWERVKLGYYAYKHAKYLPFKLVTGTEWECRSIKPSELEALQVRFAMNVIDENGKKDQYTINPFQVFQ